MPTRYSDNFMDRLMLDHLTNPWFDTITPVALGLIMVGVFIFWLWFRINRCLPYGLLWSGLVLDGLVMVGFLKDKPFPSPLGIILTVMLLLLIVSASVALLVVFAVAQLPACGVEEAQLVQKNGLIRFYLPIALAFVVYFLLWMFFAEPFIVFSVVSKLGSFTGGMVAILCGTLFSGIGANLLVPYDEVLETTYFTETSAPSHQIVSPFRRTGDAGIVERLCFPIMWVAGCAVVVFLSASAESREANWFGVLLLVVLATSILMTELSRARARGEFEEALGVEVPGDAEAKGA